MLSKLKWRNIRLPFKLLLFYTPLIIIPAVIGMYLITQSYTTSSKQMTEQYASDLMSLMVQKIDDRLLEYEQLSKQIMTNEDLHRLVRTVPTSSFEQLSLENAINKQLNALWLGDEQNKYIQSIKITTDQNTFTYGNDDVNDYGVLNSEYIEKVAGERGSVVWFAPESYTNGYENFSAFRLARVIRDRKLEALGLLTIVIDAEAVTSIFNQTKFKEEVSLQLLDRQGDFILGNKNDITPDESQVLTFSEESIQNGWRLSARLPLEPLFKPISEMVRLSVIIIIICVLLGLLVTHIIAVDVVIPVRKLMVNMKHGIKGVKPSDLERFKGGIEIVEMNDTFISVMYEIDQLIKQVIKNEKLKQRAEINVLQKQLAPHFLYNTLNSIRWMAMIQKQDNIKEMVGALNRLLTYSIRRTGEPVMLEEELAAISDYVKIQKVRYQNFEFSTRIEQGTEKLQILKLLIQPLIENSLLYGLADTDQPGKILLETTTIDYQLIIQVSDNGIGMEEDVLADVQKSLYYNTIHEVGIGLKSVHERIQLHYGNEYGLKIESELKKGTSVQLTMPIKHADSTQMKEDE